MIYLRDKDLSRRALGIVTASATIGAIGFAGLGALAAEAEQAGTPWLKPIPAFVAAGFGATFLAAIFGLALCLASRVLDRRLDLMSAQGAYIEVLQQEVKQGQRTIIREVARLRGVTRDQAAEIEKLHTVATTVGRRRSHTPMRGLDPASLEAARVISRRLRDHS